MFCRGSLKRAALVFLEGKFMARKSRYMGYINGYEQLKEKHERRRKINKEKSLTKKLNQYKKEVKDNEYYA